MTVSSRFLESRRCPTAVGAGADEGGADGVGVWHPPRHEMGDEVRCRRCWTAAAEPPSPRGVVDGRHPSVLVDVSEGHEPTERPVRLTPRERPTNGIPAPTRFLGCVV